MAQKKKIKKSDSGIGVDLLDKEKRKIKPPSKYKVVYHNDDYTPMDLVTISLIQIFHHSPNRAYQLMSSVHIKGKAIVGGPYSKEIADTKCKTAVQFFRSMGYPLLSTIEKE